MSTYPNLTAAVNAHYDTQAEKFRQDLETITAAEATDHSYYSRTTTPKLYEAIKALPQDQPLPDWIKEKMLSKFQRIKDKERNKKLQKLADVAALSPLESVTVNVEWKRNPTWGHNPTAEIRAFGDGYSAKLTVGKASGCGYDKESAAIATAMNGNLQVLRAMYDHAERGGTFPYSVYTFAGLPYFDCGCGVSCFRNVFEAMGYKWRNVAHGKTYDVYSIEVTPAIELYTNPEKFLKEATSCALSHLEDTQRGSWSNLQFEHVDASGYWFKYLDISGNSNSWCVRFPEVAAKINK